MKNFVSHPQPSVIVLQNTKDSKRSARIKSLGQKIIALAATRKLKAALFSHEQIRRAFFGDGKGTKQAIAEIIAKRFPDELGSRLPPKRKAWMSEKHSMTIFDAVALALMLRLKKVK